jgi:hypothetical protein
VSSLRARHLAPGLQPHQCLRPPSGVPWDLGLHRRRGPPLVAPFGPFAIRTAISFGALLLGEVGQQHTGRGLAIAKRLWPRPLVRRLPALGLLLLIGAKKKAVAV